MSPSFAVADAHVDVLWRMDREHIPFYGETTSLLAGYSSLLAGGVRTQVFALFTMPSRSAGEQTGSILRQIDLFQERVVHPDQVIHVQSRRTYQTVKETGQLAALLSLEGGGGLQGQVELLRVFHRLGVQGLGLTWNVANELADGCMEPRGGGLTAAGQRVVEELGNLHMWVDLAHLSDAGVRDVLHRSKGPVMVSHANSRKIHDHPRNLTDEVIKELLVRHGWIGLTFEASFVAPVQEARVEDVFRHVDHMLDLGAENHLGFGSDFDGASHPLPGLKESADYPSLADRLQAQYGKALTEKLLYRNFDAFLQKNLP